MTHESVKGVRAGLRMALRRGGLITLLCGVAAGISGCGSPGAPLPPSLNLPSPVQDLSAARTGGVVHLAWTMPKRTTDRIALKRPVTAQICRQFDNGPCATVATLHLQPGAEGQYDDVLPPALQRPPRKLIAYAISLMSRAGKTAGSSNAAYTASGETPAPISGLTAQTRPDGVLLSWHSVAGPAEPTQFRIARMRKTPAGRPIAEKKPAPSPAAKPANKNPLAASPPPENETLVVHSSHGADPGRALDTSAEPGQEYTYTVQRVASVAMAGHEFEMAGQLSEPVRIDTTDVFPPAPPQGLAAVADSTAQAIDLSWLPDSESDLAGYFVYRRDTGSTTMPERISPTSPPLSVASFHDPTAQSGHRYAYSVSAVDQSGNESPRSAEVEETMPAH